jgi:hypothetical protein
MNRSFPAQPQAVRRVENDELRAQARWPARVQLRVVEPDKTYAVMPYAFDTSGQAAEDARVRRLALACRLLWSAESLLVEGGSVAQRVAAAQLEAHAILAAVFGGDALVWETLVSGESRLSYALVESEAYHSGHRSLDELTAEEAASLARARGVAWRVAAAGMVRLGLCTVALDRLLASVDRYCEARQTVSDLRSWRADLAQRRPTTTVARLLSVAPSVLSGAIAAEVLSGAVELCEDAKRALEGAEPPGWVVAIDTLTARVKSVLGKSPVR